MNQVAFEKFYRFTILKQKKDAALLSYTFDKWVISEK